MTTERRTFLRRIGALSVAAGTAGCGSVGERSTPGRDDGERDVGPDATASTPTALADQWGFDRAVDLAAAGADTTGETPIDDVLREQLDSSVLVFLPEGTYRLAESIAVNDLHRVGLFGRDATVVPPDGNDDVLFGLGWRTPIDAAFVQGITFDFTAENTGGRPILARANDTVFIEDVTVRGEADVEQDLVRVDVTGSGGSGVVRRLHLPDGAPSDTKVTGCEVGDTNRGDVSFVDCRIDGFPDNGLYANPPEGDVRVIGGRYRNNGVAGVRVEVAGDAVVRGVHVRCDDAEGAGENMRGIRLRAGNAVLVEDCLVEMLEVTSSDGGITFASELAGATVRNCAIRVDADGVNAVRVKQAASESSRAGQFVCDSLTITGNAAGGAAIDASDRSDLTLREICMYQPGADRDGVRLSGVSGEFHGLRVSVTGEPFVIEDGDVDRSDVVVGDGTEDPTDAEEGPCA